jgi:hypothetical protein
MAHAKIVTSFRRRRVFLVASLFLSAACACSSGRPVDPASVNANSIAMGTINCHTPYELSRDCSKYRGATRTVSIEGSVVEMAGSGNGTVALIMDGMLPPVIPPAAFNLSLLESPASETYKETSIAKILRRLSKGGISLTRIRPITRKGRAYGFVIEMRGDGYALLAD